MRDKTEGERKRMRKRGKREGRENGESERESLKERGVGWPGQRVPGATTTVVGGGTGLGSGCSKEGREKSGGDEDKKEEREREWYKERSYFIIIK